MRFSSFRVIVLRALALPLVFGAALAAAQDVTKEVVVRTWWQSTPEQKISAINAGLDSPSKQDHALALIGISRLGAEDPATARRLFPAGTIHPYLLDADSDTADAAARAWLVIADSDAAAEAHIVAVVTSGQSARRPHEFIRYIRADGITSEVARKWLMSLAQGPLSVEKYSTTEALVSLEASPPATLLPHAMELMRSREYFCTPSLVLSLKKFGRPASRYLDEVIALRAKLEAEGKLRVDDRSVKLMTAPDVAVSLMDEAIAALRQ
jgi:hypothetical protein